MYKETDLFANYIFSSPAIWVNEEDIYHLEEEYHNNNSDLPKNIYLSAGTGEVIIVQSAIDPNVS